MRLKFKKHSFHLKKRFPEFLGQLSSRFSTEKPFPENTNSRMERRRQAKESKIDNRMYRSAIIAFYVICSMLCLMPIVYFLPWERTADWFVFLLLGALFVSFTLSAISIKKQSKYVKLPYMWGVMLFSALLLLFYLFILVYFHFFLS